MDTTQTTTKLGRHIEAGDVIDFGDGGDRCTVESFHGPVSISRPFSDPLTGREASLRTPQDGTFRETLEDDELFHVVAPTTSSTMTVEVTIRTGRPVQLGDLQGRVNGLLTEFLLACGRDGTNPGLTNFARFVQQHDERQPCAFYDAERFNR